jgi:uncharacterized protein YfbU (UPF0304 family)
VPILADDEKPGETRNATLILRLVLDQQGQLKYGEFVDVTSGYEKRFRAWNDMIRMLRVWLNSQTSSQPPVDPQKLA